MGAPDTARPKPAGVPGASPGANLEAALQTLASAAAARLGPREAEALIAWARVQAAAGAPLPGHGRGLAWTAIAEACGIDPVALRQASRRLAPAFHRLLRELGAGARAAPGPEAPRPHARRPHARPRGRPPAPPRPAAAAADFAAALDAAMRRWGEGAASLARGLAEAGAPIAVRRLVKWRRGEARPGPASLAAVAAIERRYGLPEGELAARLARPPRRPPTVRDARWRLPDDYAARPAAEQAEILAWVRRTFGAGSDYRRYQARAGRHPYRIAFDGVSAAAVPGTTRTGQARQPVARRMAGDPLAAQMADLIAFKTAALAPPGRLRRGLWNPATAAQHAHRFGLLLGALAASPRGPVRGLGVAVEDLTLALLVLPAVWDWHLAWRERRRGFFTRWEAQMLDTAAALAHPEAGWLTQSPDLAGTLRPLEGLVSAEDIAQVRADWPGACARLHGFARMRARELGRVARSHRDPFEAILPVLEAASPLAEYLKIPAEALRHAPCPRRDPVRAAEAIRGVLMLRLGLQLGFRSRNLSELLICPPGQAPRPERKLAALRRAELRWDPLREHWEVFAPPAAFKNAGSSFFGGAPFRLPIPDRGGLYDLIADYLTRHRRVLLAGAADPGAVFVRHVRSPGDPPALDRFRFHEAWRGIVARHGVHNPYTGRGAIPGLLPHGPHAVRAVLATHVLKMTGSFEQAAYAIQDTPGSIQRHYARFLPSHKAAIAARVLDAVWDPPRGAGSNGPREA
ncbi:hypothetical protein [Phenylobacterium sp.]|uniref:hypothetical protein n=1 Tax=Phenylobacterium sp. TaxID=1871053 RepID=UPI0035AF8549